MVAVAETFRIPQDVWKKVEELQADYKEEEITLKGYVKRLRSLLDTHLMETDREEIAQLEKRLKDADITEGTYFKKLEKLLDSSLELAANNDKIATENKGKLQNIPSTKRKFSLFAYNESSQSGCNANAVTSKKIKVEETLESNGQGNNEELNAHEKEYESISQENNEEEMTEYHSNGQVIKEEMIVEEEHENNGQENYYKEMAEYLSNGQAIKKEMTECHSNGQAIKEEMETEEEHEINGQENNVKEMAEYLSNEGKKVKTKSTEKQGEREINTEDAGPSLPSHKETKEMSHDAVCTSSYMSGPLPESSMRVILWNGLTFAEVHQHQEHCADGPIAMESLQSYGAEVPAPGTTASGKVSSQLPGGPWEMEGKKEVEKINTEDLIHEVENHPAVWDSSIEQYSNKNEKRNAWSEIIMHLIPDFEGKSPAEKNEIAAHVQKKWKGIRASYTRELIKKKNEKSGSAASGRKQYVYFEILRFLETVCKRTASSMDNYDDGDAENDGEQEGDMETPRETEETAKCPKHSSKKKNNDDELIQVLKDKLLRENEQPSNESDEDRLFLLSLVSELKKVPADKKLQVKSQIITTIAQAQQAYQQLPQYQYPALPVYHPTHPPHNFHHAQQQTFHGGQYSHNNPIPSGSAPVQATPTPSPSPSIFSDASSVNDIIFHQ